MSRTVRSEPLSVTMVEREADGQVRRGLFMTHSVGGEHVTEAQPISAAETVTDRGLPAASGHASPTALRLLSLQQAIGNHAVSRLLQRNGGTPGGPAGAPAPTDATMLEVESGVGKEGEIEQKNRGAPLEAKDN